MYDNNVITKKKLIRRFGSKILIFFSNRTNTVAYPSELTSMYVG